MKKIIRKIWLMNKILRHQAKQYNWCEHHDVKPPEKMSLWHMIWHKPIDSLQIAVDHYDAKKADSWFDFCHKCEKPEQSEKPEQIEKAKQSEKAKQNEKTKSKTHPQQAISQTA